MSKSQRAVLDVLFPEVRAKLLQLLFTAAGNQRYVHELANMSELACTLFRMSFASSVLSVSSSVGRTATTASIRRTAITRCILSCSASFNSAKAFRAQTLRTCAATDDGALRKGKPNGKHGRYRSISP